MPNKKYPTIVFKERIKTIRKELEDYCNDTADLHRKSIGLIENYNEKIANEVIEKSKQLAVTGYEIERNCIRFIAVEQPLASDLMYIESSIRIISHVKRISHLCSNIAESSNLIKEIKEPKELLSDLQYMADYVQIMLTKGFRSFINQDIHVAKELFNDDDKVDELFDSILNQVTEIFAKKQDNALGYIYILFLSRYLERIADRVVNIGDRVIFINTHKRPNIEQLKEEEDL